MRADIRNYVIAFNASYKKLNSAQREAVDCIEGPVMVVAGPGTGKTHILTLRIANILLKTDTPPDGILALTFTEAGVDAMKQRLLKLIGPTAYKIGIHTFHGFCNDIIHSHPQYFPRIISSQALTDIESIIFIREAITELPLEKLKPFGDPFFYVQTARNAIATLKREHKTPADVSEKTHTEIARLESDPDSFHAKGAHKGKMKGVVQTRIERLKKERELGQVFERYEQKLVEKKKFDFEDMIAEVVRALYTNEEFLMVVREKYLYILADEHQDANGAQNQLLELLTSYDPSPNLFIVGDEKQAIFRFQGASLDSFSYFRKKFPTARIVALVDSYRSGSVLLDAAHSLMREEIPAERHPQLASRVSQPHLAVLEERTFTSEDMEIEWVTSDIAERIAEGVNPGDIAVIFRNNADALPVSRALSRRGILHTLDSRSNIFTNHCVAQLLTYMRLCTHIGKNEYLAHALHFSWVGVTANDAYKIMIHADKLRLPYLEVMSSKTHLKGARVGNVDAVYERAQIVHRLAKVAQEESARDFFDSLLRDSGLLAYILARPDAIPLLNAVRGLAGTLETLSATKTLYTGRDFVHDLGLYEEYGIEIEPDTQPEKRSSAVHLVTAHRSKGLEYDYVYIIHARDGKWGNRKNPDKLPLLTLATLPLESDIKDERRLFYVALTRAKAFVSVSYGVTAQNRSREATITQFMLEIDPALVKREDTSAFEASVPPDHMFTAPNMVSRSLDDHAFIVDAFVEQGLSATALNNYLECPWKYFYRNLVRVPEKPTSSSLYGNALHNALHLFRDTCTATGVYQPLPLLLEYLKTSIDTQGFTPASYEDALKKGERALTDWHERNQEGYEFRVLCEKKIEVYMAVSHTSPSASLSQILLRGKLDAIQFNSDGTVEVIDYKTGRHRSRNEIESNTKNATGDYKRQLDFYCILMELARMDRPNRLTLEFIEPDEKGKTISHTFEYSPEAIKGLKETITRVAGEIFSLSFWNTRCHNKDCEHCKLRDMIEG